MLVLVNIFFFLTPFFNYALLGIRISTLSSTLKVRNFMLSAELAPISWSSSAKIQ